MAIPEITRLVLENNTKTIEQLARDTRNQLIDGTLGMVNLNAVHVSLDAHIDANYHENNSVTYSIETLYFKSVFWTYVNAPEYSDIKHAAYGELVHMTSSIDDI